MNKLTQVPPEHFDKAPGRCLDDIKDALSYGFGERDIEHVVAALVAGENQLWVYYDDKDTHIATVVTRIVDYEASRYCVIEYIGGVHGDTAQYFDHVQEIEDWARYNGCSDIRILGRPGWRRAMKPHGFDRWYEVLGKSL